ncbi:putative O-glycosylation ligase, exosortase A system-associated [Thiosocius teredinicola]|uniref:putative O-glycosylation ligase, exosortase A system-associated n=1 Tax=Thiosocius teredinicola TaxID=1973002 RepID=UPI000990B9AE
MRDIILFMFVFGMIPYMLRNPYIGVLMWSWFSYMNPHRLTWGAAYSFPFAQLIAIVLFASLLMDKETKRLPKSGIIVVWVMFIIWAAITSLNGYYADAAWGEFVRLFKIQLIIFLTMLIMNTPERIKLMVWVIYFSIGFFGIKGGVFTLLTGGGERVWGPAFSFIEDNNHLAVALLMVLPLGYYLVRNEMTNPWLKAAMWLGMFFITLSVIGSQSRGAFLAIICVAGYLWLKSDKKIVMAAVIIPLLPLMFLFMPQSWHDRMSTIENYEEDASAMGRINAWTYSVNAANANITGVGMNSWSYETFALWAPDPQDVHAAHSIYFSVIADHGWIGFAMFMFIFGGGWLVARGVIKYGDRSEEHRWTANLARMIQVCLVAYGTGGAFLSLSYFDLPWHLVAIILLLQQFLKREGVWAAKKPPFAQQLQASRGEV